MKTILLTIAIALSTQLAFSQKLLKPDIDKLSGDTTWRTNEEAVFVKETLIEASRTVTMQAVKAGNTYMVYISVTEPQSANWYSISAGSKAFLKLADKSIITLKAAEDNLTQPVGSYTRTYGSVNEGTKTIVLYQISKDDLQTLSATPIEFIRLESSKGNLDYDIKPKFAVKVEKNFGLILTK